MNPGHPVADQGSIRENKLELVERLADDLAHEIKNPLHSMVINLEVLRRRLLRLGPEPSEDLLRYASVLSSELDRVNRRVDLLLRMVRPPRDADDLAGISEVMEELRELVELECQRHATALEMSPPPAFAKPDLPRAATRQMLLTLILDTLDLAPPGGVLRVNATTDDDGTRVEIVATGANGAPPAARDRDEDTSYLSVARSLAERLGVQLDAVASDPHPTGNDPAQLGYVLTLPPRD